MTRTVLIVDDDPGILLMLSHALKPLGWRVLSAEGPLMAALLYEQCDVVLTDWDMPFGGGLNVLQGAQRAQKPVVVHTGNSEDVPDTLPMVTKPSAAQSIHEALMAVLRRRPQRPEVTHA